MREVVIAGLGQTPVGEHWGLSMAQVSYQAIKAAIADAGGLHPQALYVANFLGSMVSHQANLGTVLADNAGLTGIETITIESAGASGGAAMQVGVNAVKSGLVDVAMVIGVEKFTDAVNPEVESALAQALDGDYEAPEGMSLAAQAGLLMQRYLHLYHAPRADFAAFPLIAHANAVHNPYAMYRKAIKQETYDKASMVADPVNLFDMASYADGAAAVILTTPELAGKLSHKLVRVDGTAGVIDTLSLHDRPDPLAFDAARIAVTRASEMAGILPGEVDLFEMDDSFSIYAALQLEAANFAERGQGLALARSGDLALKGKLPILTFGGNKGRGNPIAAAGVYQIVEAALQLRGQAGENQVANARRALTLCLGGAASSAYAHVLSVS
ncbi:MAG TPA: thiolase domain-containing protein [Bellilinea sp.]|nr:thiolase domain-containing protein [Bellilinea sp.]